VNIMPHKRKPPDGEIGRFSKRVLVQFGNVQAEYKPTARRRPSEYHGRRRGRPSDEAFIVALLVAGKPEIMLESERRIYENDREGFEAAARELAQKGFAQLNSGRALWWGRG
jgi:hypothetical protein